MRFAGSTMAQTTHKDRWKWGRSRTALKSILKRRIYQWTRWLSKAQLQSIVILKAAISHRAWLTSSMGRKQPQQWSLHLQCLKEIIKRTSLVVPFAEGPFQKPMHHKPSSAWASQPKVTSSSEWSTKTTKITKTWIFLKRAKKAQTCRSITSRAASINFRGSNRVTTTGL